MVYPRGCGGTLTGQKSPADSNGLSPRVRGNHIASLSQHANDRSIPAGAGEPRYMVFNLLVQWVYPRGCGGTCDHGPIFPTHAGLSPRVRGNQSLKLCHYHNGTVYPRGCGGTRMVDSVQDKDRGLSPRVRGNPTPANSTAKDNRSIPAGAGEPAFHHLIMGLIVVYPRGCGGTTLMNAGSDLQQGLSPRVRGNRLVVRFPCREHRSIPAGAGEPFVMVVIFSPFKVYPRGCGGTFSRSIFAFSAAGLSPRVRGNHKLPGTIDTSQGSIPAGAGEPFHLGGRMSKSEVYPRGCGGTPRMAQNSTSTKGLSPRVRGNQRLCPFLRKHLRSIPAGAGEPGPTLRPHCAHTVYPRGCGGTNVT